ncbi:MAG: DUF87 domain-containing protein [Candidatus Doudnabacteria bacterium]|nr:DUF87 domain-containing protein [Candidatus Doudnabacteria bacterium]
MENQKETITLFAKTNFRNKEVPFGIKTDDHRRHMYLIGKTGMGKTTLMENMAIQDIRNGNGVAFLDPHGDSIQKILNCVPSSRVNDVVYFNPADLDHPVAFNILEAVDPRYKHLVASGLMGVFTKIWANVWSARMEYILNNTVLALLESPGNTLLGITRMYVDKKYRKKIVDNIKDPMVRAFWTDEYANYNEKYRTEAIAPIQNKVGQFLSSGIIRNIVGQPKSTIDLREIMDKKKILIMDLSKGKVGEDNSALLGAMLVTKLQLAAMSRTDVLESERSDFYLYVDEFQNFANLPKYQIILKLMINGVASEPFSAITLAPNPEYFTNNAEKVIKVSRERYSNSLADVEDKISRWMGTDFHQETALLIGEGREENNTEEKQGQTGETKPMESKNAKLEAPKLEERKFKARENVKQFTPRPSKDHSPKHKDHNQPQKQKKENPVWDIIAKMGKEKNEATTPKFQEQAIPVPQKAIQEEEKPEESTFIPQKTILKPGEPHKLP